MGRRHLRFSSVDIIICNRSMLVHEVMHTSASLWDTPARNMRGHCREWPADKYGFRNQAFRSRKQQPARSYSVHWWFSHQKETVGPHMPSSSYFQWACYNNNNNKIYIWDGKPRMAYIYQPSTFTFKNWMFCPGQAGVKGKSSHRR